MDKASGIYFQNMNQKELAERRNKNDVIIIPLDKLFKEEYGT